MGMRPYVVKQGDYLTRLAYEMGFEAEEVWTHTLNDELRGRRAHGDILLPGDVLYVPEPQRPEHSIEPEVVNRYCGWRPQTPVNLMLKDEAGTLANARCTIEGLGPDLVEGHTDEEGRLCLNVPLYVREVRLVFPEREFVCSVLLGYMDPLTEPSGVLERLANLGHSEPVEGAFDGTWDDPQLVQAITAFQHEHGLEATGAMNDVTRDALWKEYGT